MDDGRDIDGSKETRPPLMAPWTEWPKPVDERRVPTFDQTAADAWCARMCAAAGQLAAATATWLSLVAEFDASGGWSGGGIRHCAHWLSWACSLSPGTAREHVRVARCLRQLPLISAAFTAGELSYSKVREATRAADRVEEVTLLKLTKTCTASQLERAIRAFRRHDTDRLEQELRRRVRWYTDTDGSLVLRARLPAEEGAVMLAALEKSADMLRHHEKNGEQISNADALVHIASRFVDSSVSGSSTNDRGLVVVEVDAEALAEAHPGNDKSGDPMAACRIVGVGGVTAATAARMSCEGSLLGIVSKNSAPFRHGRRRRLVSSAQRRSLELRDNNCQHPGCQRTARLEAHHVVPWSAGGPTDLDNLLLLCRFHHMIVHEARFSIVARDGRWVFFQPNGVEVTAERWIGYLRRFHDESDIHRALELLAIDVGELEKVSRWTDPSAERIRPGWRGESFDLAAAVGVLFGAKTNPSTDVKTDAKAAA